MSRFPSAAASATLGGGLAAVAFAAQSGTELSSTVPVAVLLTLTGGAFVALAVLRDGGGPVHGGFAVLLLGVFTAVTVLSAAWSIAPADSAQEAARTLAYLFVFAGAVGAARQFRGAGETVACGLAIAGLIVCVWALATRILPGTLGGDLLLTSRLGAPFDYWNALGSMAALTLPALLWLGARRDSPRGTSALAFPGMGVLMLTLLLTQSRGAVAAVVLVLIAWFVLVPLRLRSALLVGLPAIAAVPVAAWALSRAQFTDPFQLVSAQEAVAGDFGLLVLTMCVALFAVGAVMPMLSARLVPSPRGRRRAGVALVGGACIAVVVVLASLGFGDRGLDTVSDRFSELTSETAPPPAGASRLASAASSRGEYWRQALRIFDERPLEGTGAGTFHLARLAYRRNSREAAHAHGFSAQTLSDLGLAGTISSLALLAAWLTSAASTLGLVPGRRRRPAWTGERLALATLALCAIAFGLQSAIDWTWSVPGTAVAALVAAGYVAGRGPLPAATDPPADLGPPAARGVHTGRAVAAGGVMAASLLCCWAIWQPERAARANDRALDAVERGDYRAAKREADGARNLDPYSPEPLYAQSAALSGLGERQPAYRVLEQAVIEHPRDPEPWLRLAAFELRRLDLPLRALESLVAAGQVDPFSGRLTPLRRQAEEAAGISARAP